MSSNDEPTDVQLDISQFEGHSPGPWDDEHSPFFSEHEDDADVLTIKTEPAFDSEKTWLNQRLAASAPELLEEVKRLRKELEWFKQAINITADHIPQRAHWDAYVAEMVEKGLWPDEPED